MWMFKVDSNYNVATLYNKKTDQKYTSDIDEF